MTEQHISDLLNQLSEEDLAVAREVAQALKQSGRSPTFAVGDLDICRLLDEDSAANHADGIRACLGDHYLCAYNPIYGRIRHLALSLGCRFSASCPEDLKGYGVVPLLFLDAILRQGIVPVQSNTDVFRQIVEQCPSVRLDDSMIRSKNYLLHESAHFVADRSLSVETAADESREAFVLKALGGEAYANASERLAAAMAVEPVHSALFKINSYVSFSGQSGSLFQRSCDVLGTRSVLQLGILGSLYLNLKPGADQLDSKSLTMILSSVLDSSLGGQAEIAVAATITEAGFTLSRKFRETTTPTFFKYLGYEREFCRLSSRSFESILSSNGLFIDSLLRLAGKTCDPLVA